MTYWNAPKEQVNNFFTSFVEQINFILLKLIFTDVSLLLGRNANLKNH